MPQFLELVNHQLIHEFSVLGFESVMPSKIRFSRFIRISEGRFQTANTTTRKLSVEKFFQGLTPSAHPNSTILRGSLKKAGYFAFLFAQPGESAREHVGISLSMCPQPDDVLDIRKPTCQGFTGVCAMNISKVCLASNEHFSYDINNCHPIMRQLTPW